MSIGNTSSPLSLLRGCGKRLCAALILLVLAAGCGGGGGGPSPGRVPARSVDWWLQQLTLEEKVGQLFWFGLPGADIGPETEQLLREGKAGGFVLFARQGNGIGSLTGRLQALAAGRGRPTPGLIISVDHEGGIVQRWGPPNFTVWPGNMAVGATRSEAYAQRVAAAMAQELAAQGINLNLSPDADVNNNPANPVIGVRSFGEDPKSVARLVTAAVKGSQGEQVSAVAKHFPGHGDTVTDSHKALPVVGHSRERLDRVELVPFRAAIAAKVDVIMSAHVLFPAVATDGLPGTLSQKVLQGLLKDEMGFKGVVVTDAIDTMKAITDNYGTEKALVMALQAGADALLVTESFGKQAGYHAVVMEAVKDGRISEARLNDAVRRNLELKARRGLLPDTGASLPHTPAPREQNAQLALQVGAEALTLVRNKYLPLKLTAEQRVLAVGPSYAAEVQGVPEIRTALGAGLKAAYPNVREVTLDKRPTAAGAANVKAAAQQADAIVYGVYNAGDYPEQQALIKDLIATGKPVIVVGMGEPYDLVALPQAQTYIAAYGYQAPNLQGVGALIAGTAKPSGKLPVSIPGQYPLGHGLSY